MSGEEYRPAPYRFYLDDEQRSLPRVPPPPTEEPRPGHGKVFLFGHTDGVWEASWQDEHRHHERFGTLDEMSTWARSCPAQQRLILRSAASDDFEPL